MKRYILPLAATLLLLSSCRKEIELPYRSLEPLYVVEGRVTNETIEVLVTRTRDMEDGQKKPGVPGATVTLSTDGGTAETLNYHTDGFYRPEGTLTGEPGKTYRVRVAIDGQEFTSFSSMNSPATIEKLEFRWIDFMHGRMLFCSVEVKDAAGEDNYYCYRMRRNGENYQWHVFNDRGYDGENIPVEIACMTEQQAKENKEEDREEILYDGDEIEVEVQAIDRRTYDYLYSVGLSEHTLANPIDNFTGGCLGYFSAYSTVRKTITFRSE